MGGFLKELLPFFHSRGLQLGHITEVVFMKQRKDTAFICSIVLLVLGVGMMVAANFIPSLVLPFNGVGTDGTTFGILPAVISVYDNLGFNLAQGNQQIYGFVSIFGVVVIVLFLLLLFRGIFTKNGKLVARSIFLLLSGAATTIISNEIITVRSLHGVPNFGHVYITGALALLVLSFVLVAVSTVVVSLPKVEAKAKEESKPGLSEEEVRNIVKDEEKDDITEEQVREIVREELSKNAPKEEPKPVKEEKKEPEPEPEPEPEEEVEEEEAPEASAQAVVAPVEGEEGNKVFVNKRRHASFETKVKNSEYDLRHKYYDLRDYIRSYGVKNRISIPGDTFSAHRERYAFITVSGKKLKLYVALNPDDYANSPIPVERVDSKKFEDLPCLFRIKSDLSYKRACKLIDDVMAAKGVEKPEQK